MVEIEELVARVVNTIGPVYAKKGVDALAGLMKKAFQSVYQKGGIRTDEIQELAQFITKNPPSALDVQKNVDILSRWFEVPRDDFDTTPIERLETEVLVRHVYLEQLFESWFVECGYEISIGEKMVGLEGWEFVADIYASLNTIHGRFQIVVNFVCQNPPSTSRVSFLLESLEAFAKKREPDFSEKDIFMVITPFKFGATASAAITKEDKDHTYYVVKVESNDISRLLHEDNMQTRLGVFQNIVKEAYGTGGEKTWA